MAQKTLLADGNRRKPPISNVQQNSMQSDKDNSSIITEQSSGATRPLSTATLDGLSILDDIEDIDDDITTSASDSYAHEEDLTSNEGNARETKQFCIRMQIFFFSFFFSFNDKQKRNGFILDL